MTLIFPKRLRPANSVGFFPRLYWQRRRRYLLTFLIYGGRSPRDSTVAGQQPQCGWLRICVRSFTPSSHPSSVVDLDAVRCRHNVSDAHSDMRRIVMGNRMVPVGQAELMFTHILFELLISAINVIKTYQFKTHCKGDSHSSKTANIILPGLMIKQRWTSLRLQAKW